MNKLQKIALTGLGVMVIISLLLYFLAGVSFRFIVPFYLPWTVLLLIGFTTRKKS